MSDQAEFTRREIHVDYSHVGFADRSMEFLDRAQYRRIDGGEELEAIYKLRYRAYVRHNLVPPNPDEIVTDSFDSLPNCSKFGIYIDGDLAATIRLHHVTKDTPHSPTMEVFGDVLRGRLDNGLTYIDPSRFAVSPQWASNKLAMPAITMRIAFMACLHFSAPYCITMIRKEHAVFYKQMFGSRQVGQPRNYDGVINCDALLYEGEIASVREQIEVRFPFFASTAVERRLLFDRPSIGENAPLIVLPTARHAAVMAA